jgi:hypothetical protein
MKLHRFVIIAALLLSASIIESCEDSSVLNYVPEYVVEGYLIVGEPIRDIRVLITQSVSERFQYANTAIANANVQVFVGGSTTPLILTYRPDSLRITPGGYAFSDSTFLVQPQTEYRLEVRLQNGMVMTGKTTTPPQIRWTRPPFDIVQFPFDTTTYPSPDSLRLGWTAVGRATAEYLFSMRSLDTLNYGRFLTPETPERNRRTPLSVIEDDDNQATSVSRIEWKFLQTNSTPLNWTAFKWYGLHEVIIYAADQSFINWFKFSKFSDNQSQEYDRNFSNITGGKGVFGSASIVRDTLFVLKNRP